MKGFVVALLALGCAPQQVVPSGTPEEQTWFEVVRAAVSPGWASRVEAGVKENDPRGCKYSEVDRRVVVEFAVDAHGAITGVRLLRSSDVAYLDRAALIVFRAAAPLPPPPASMIDKPLQFTFTLKARPGGEQGCWRWAP